MVPVGDSGSVVVERVLLTLRGEFVVVHGCGGVELWVGISRVWENNGTKIAEGGWADQRRISGTWIESGDTYIESARRWSRVSQGSVLNVERRENAV